MREHQNKQYYIKLNDEQKTARKSRAIGILTAVLLFALIIYIATYAKFSA